MLVGCPRPRTPSLLVPTMTSPFGSPQRNLFSTKSKNKPKHPPENISFIVDKKQIVTTIIPYGTSHASAIRQFMHAHSLKNGVVDADAADAKAQRSGRGGAREAGHDGQGGSAAAVLTCQHHTGESDQIWAGILHV